MNIRDDKEKEKDIAESHLEFDCSFDESSDWPAELLCTLFCYLDERTKRKCREVHPDWKFILDTHFLKYTAYISDKSYSAIINSEVSFGTVKVRNFTLKLPPEDELDPSKNKLVMSPSTLVFEQNPPYHPNKSPSISQPNILKMILFNWTSKEIIFERNTLKALDSPLINKIYLPYLTKLQMTLSTDGNKEEKSALLQIAKMKMPMLSELTIETKITSTNYGVHEKQQHYFNLFEFLAVFRASLKVLSFFNEFMLLFNQAPLRLWPVEPPVEPWRPSLANMGSLVQKLSEIQLREFKFKFVRHEGFIFYNLGFQLLENQRNLSLLEVNFDSVSDNLLLHVERAILRNSSTLRHFAIRNYTFSILHVTIIESILSGLHLCRNLASLTMDGFVIPNLSTACPSLKITVFEFRGSFEPSLLLEFSTMFPRLETLRLSHNDSVELSQHEELSCNLKRLLMFPHLNTLTWWLQGFDMSFLNEIPGITVVKVHQYIDYYSITIKH